jgi:hypothetical protein
MVSRERTASALDKKFEKVRGAPAGFDLFVSIHDFVDYIESVPDFSVFFRQDKKKNRAAELSAKYVLMRQIHQGIEDIDVRTKKDLGHDRYVAIRDLNLIRADRVSENNNFWKQREVLRRLAGEVHRTLRAHLAEIEK